ncbi:hypothetical protein [Dactylosporangium sp. NPDC048998]|uniref:hypothetical protein n=1 Tax=Dactylosporangium sp. NPDC048998 TaxID=3363976 RepID=UPI00371E7802
MLKEVTEAVRGRQTINPRTVLGFYATVLGLLLAAVVSGSAVLASTKTATWLIPWLILFAAVMFVALIAGVFVITLIDPSKLMLTQISGTEYATIRKITLGSSESERTELIAIRPLGATTLDASSPETLIDTGSTQAIVESFGDDRGDRRE